MAELRRRDHDSQVVAVLASDNHCEGGGAQFIDGNGLTPEDDSNNAVAALRRA